MDDEDSNRRLVWKHSATEKAMVHSDISISAPPGYFHGRGSITTQKIVVCIPVYLCTMNPARARAPNH